MAARKSRKTIRSRGAAGRNLSRYNAKRNLEISGEPAGAVDERPLQAAAIRRFVIQRHDATRLHYDFRLEMDGVLRSWAVPKGLPEKTGDRALAIEVEDHPLEYGTFEGVIPEGNYGAGSVMLWDRGRYTVADGTPEEAYRAGKIHMALMGEKVVGEWTLVRLKGRGTETKTSWLVIRNAGPQHQARMTGAKREVSVLTGRTQDEIAVGTKKSRRKSVATPAPAATKAVSKSGRGAAAPKKKAAAPRSEKNVSSGGARLAPAEFIPPMKAMSMDRVPTGKWRLEIKLDGYRAVAVINQGAIELWSRNHKPLTEHYPEIVAALQRLRCKNAVLDGEIVALDEQGRSRFQLMQRRDTGADRPNIVYYVFDLLHLDGESIMGRPIEDRQAKLEDLVGDKLEVVRFSPVFETDPAEMLEAVRKQGLEGIIAKEPGSIYEPNRRSGAWLKAKVFGEQEFVIGGFTPPRNSREYFGAIVVGYYDGDKLIYAGKVGSGFGRERLATLHREFLKRRVSACPFANLPQPRKPRYGLGMTSAAMREVTWIKPELVAQVRFAEWTHEGSLRQPVFLGLREDKRARDVVREASPIKGEA